MLTPASLLPAAALLRSPHAALSDSLRLQQPHADQRALADRPVLQALSWAAAGSNTQAAQVLQNCQLAVQLCTCKSARCNHHMSRQERLFIDSHAHGEDFSQASNGAGPRRYASR